MNRAPTVEEERQSISNPDFSQLPKYRIPQARLTHLENTATTATVVSSYEVGMSFITAATLDITGSYIISTSVPSIRVVYKKRDLTEVLLGKAGECVLDKVVELIEETSLRNKWPLSHVEVAYVEDAEVENWQYALITLVFDSAFEVADTHLHDFYNELDSLADALDSEEQDILQRKLFFDVATTI